MLNKKRITQLTASAVMVLSLSGCDANQPGSGGDGLGNDGNHSGPTTIHMETGTPYTIQAGDRIIRREDGTIINVRAEEQNKTTTATLVEGASDLVRK